MTPRNEVLEWVQAIPAGESIAIDDGGLTLVASVGGEFLKHGPYCEIGGTPLEEDND